MIYNFFIYLYIGAVRIAALFNQKVAKMWKGENDAFSILKKQIDPSAKYLWFHAASLGEFEQGRPLIEEIRKKYPQYKILQTFFSPSGYEVRKIIREPMWSATFRWTHHVMCCVSWIWLILTWLSS